LFGGDVVAEVGAHPRGHLRHVFALVAVFGWLATEVAREERVAKGVELVPRVVQVVLAMDLSAVGREQVGKRVADCDPAPAAGVQRASGVGRHELEVDTGTRQSPPMAVLVAGGDHRPQYLVEPRRREVHIDEAGPGDLGPLEMRRPLPVELHDELGRNFTWRHAQGLGELERDIRGEIAMTGILRGRERDPAGRLGKPGRRERAAERVEQLITDHEARDRDRRDSPPGRIDAS